MAEELYRKGELSDLVWGLNMLIPIFFHFDQWDNVVRCFRELLELSVKLQDEMELYELYYGVFHLRDRLKAIELEVLVNQVISSLVEMALSEEQTILLYTQIAKTFNYLSQTAPKDRQSYQEQALKYFDFVLSQNSGNRELLATILNDTSLIFCDRGDIREAISRLDQAIAIDEELGNVLGSAHSIINRAYLFSMQGRLQESHAEYEKALVPIQQRLGYWNNRLAHMAENGEMLTAHEIANMRFDKNWYAKLNNEYARLLAKMGRYIMSRAMAQLAAQVYEEIGKTREADSIRTFALTLPAEDAPDAQWTKHGLAQQAVICPTCGSKVELGAKACSRCGRSFCPECGSSLDDYDEVCPRCGWEEYVELCPYCHAQVTARDTICPSCNSFLTSLCPQCGYSLQSTVEICPSCGYDLTGKLYCSTCVAVVSEDDTVCPGCGEVFEPN